MASTACGGNQLRPNLFSTDWTDDGGQSINAVRKHLEGAKPQVGADVVVAVAGNNDKLIGLPLIGTRQKWSFGHPIDSRPVVAGSLVIASGGGELFAIDANKGTKLWARSTGKLSLLGAGDDGAVTVVTLARAETPGTVLLAIAHDGSVVRQVETDKVLGAPAVVGGLAFVPWGNQYVTVFDLASGDEAARVVLREKTSRAWTESQTLYFGEVGIFRFDDKIKDASKNGASHVGLPVRELPGTPVLMVSGSERLGPSANAHDKIRIFARASGGETGALGIDDDRFYATYFKLVMGFEAHHGKLAWVHSHTADVLGGAAAHGSLVVCDEQGKVTTLDAASGAVAGDVDLGEPLKSCVVQVDAFHEGAIERPARPLVDQISEALEGRDPELDTAQRLLLRELASIQDDQATKTLVDLSLDPRTAPALGGDARAALAARRNGARYMLEALAVHYDYLKDVLRPPPVAPMAIALAAMNEKSAAPLLAAHLLDPTDTDEDVKQAAAALVTLGGAEALPTAREFFGHYRASAANDEISAAVVSVGQVLLKNGGDEARKTIDFAIADPLTVPFVKERLSALVSQIDAEKASKAAPPPPAKQEAAPAPKK